MAEKVSEKNGGGSGSGGSDSRAVSSGGGFKKWIFVAITVVLVGVAIGWTMFGQGSSGSDGSGGSSETSETSGSIVKNAKIEDVATDGEKVNMYLFWGSTCPHCKAEYAFLESLSAEEKAKFRLYGFEIWGSEDNAALLRKVAEIVGQEAKGVPYLVIEDEVVAGYLDDESTGAKIVKIVDEKFGKKDRKDVFIEEVVKGDE